MKDLKRGAEDLGEDIKRELQDIGKVFRRGAHDIGKEVDAGLKHGREEFGQPSGFFEKVKEGVLVGLEESGLKSPRVGKSLVEVVKAAFGMLSTITGSAKEQNAALKKFDKACETFSKAVQGLFKTKEQGHHQNTKTSVAPSARSASKSHTKSPQYQAAVGRHTARKAEESKKGGRGI